MRKLAEHSLKEHQFAQLIGRARMYPHLPNETRKGIQPLHLTDTQLGLVVRDYYKDDRFKGNEQGELSLWRLYNLLTGANKGTYIDQSLERTVNAFEFVEKVRWGLEGKHGNWYLE